MHVEHRIVLRLLQHLGKVKVQGDIVFARQYDEPGDICAGLFNNVTQGHEGACAFRHLEGLAILVQLYKLDELDIQRNFAIRQRRDGGLHPLDIAAMVGAENVDQRIEPAPHFVVVIGDVGREIGPRPVRLFHRTIHIIAMRG